jgi:glutamate-1-semialdehyde 2,1-aminomutase
MGSAEVAAEVERFRERTPASAAQLAAARRSLPGGDSRSTLHYPPHPLGMARAAGGRVWDVDGHELIDLTNNHTALVHGNANPAVLDAVRAQLDDGTCFSGPVPRQAEVADRLTARIPALDRVRFCASGTEATMHAIRAARAFTGRHRIAKAEGAYHGSQDDVFVSTHPRPDQAGPADRPVAVPRSPGLGRSAREDTVVFPFNDLDATAAVLREAGPDLAAVLVEPVMGSAGMIPAEPGYLAGVREVAAEVGALFVVDEVITLRLATGGGQAWAGVSADLSCFGKMLGGGFPLGAFGGRADVLAAFDPTREGGPVVGHPGSMNAWAVGLAAAAATLDLLTPQAIDDLARRGDSLRDRLRGVADERGVPLTVTGAGSLLGLHLTAGPVRCFRDTWSEDRELAHGVFLGLINEGVLTDPRGAACLSTATTDADLDLVADAFARVLTRLTSGSGA